MATDQETKQVKPQAPMNKRGQRRSALAKIVPRIAHYNHVALSWFLKKYAGWHPPEEIVTITSALVVGLSTGLAAAAFIWLVTQVEVISRQLELSIGGVAGRLLTMTVAGLLVGYIVERWGPEIQGSGVPDVMEAAALRGGQIRTRVAPLKMAATSITIGAGGSAGSEGPIVQIGAALGSLLGRLFHFGNQRTRTLVACGAAAGIAALFNAPIAGSLFALEVVLGTFNVRSFGAVVVSAVAGGVMSRVLLNARPAFAVPAYPLHHLAELPIYVVLGILAALVAVVFIRLRGWSGQLFDAMRLPLAIKAAIGMALTGLIALLLPESGIQGSGLEMVGGIIADNVDLAVGAMILLLLCKLLATSFTLGSGNAGGIFAPSLFVGATLGGIIGTIAHALWPSVAINPGAYAIVGMAAVFSAAVRTPVTAVLIVFEMSNDYQLILPLMLATALATFLSDVITADTLYTQVLRARGITLQGGRDVDVLDSVLVEEIMGRDLHTVSTDMSLVDLAELFSHTHRHGFMVLDKHGELWGVVTVTDLDRAVASEMPRRARVDAIGTPYERLLLAYPNETMGEALSRMGVKGVGRLPVVRNEQPRHVVGMIQREDILRAYNMALTRRSELHHRAKRARLQNLEDTEFVDLVLAHGDKAAGKTMQEVGPLLPYDCILIRIRREGKTLIPHGNTVLQPGDDITAFINSHDYEALFQSLKAQ